MSRSHALESACHLMQLFPPRRRSTFATGSLLSAATAGRTFASHETRIRGPSKRSWHKGKILGQDIIVSAVGKFGRDARSSTAFVKIATGGNKLEVLDENPVVSPAGLRAAGR